MHGLPRKPWIELPGKSAYKQRQSMHPACPAAFMFHMPKGSLFMYPQHIQEAAAAMGRTLTFAMKAVKQMAGLDNT